MNQFLAFGKKNWKQISVLLVALDTFADGVGWLPTGVLAWIANAFGTSAPTP